MNVVRWCGHTQGWVWDPDCNASYLSVWGDSPSTNLASPEWRAEMKRILTRWITTLKLDGFFFDAPDSYVGAGNNGQKFWEYNPSLMREGITDVIHNVSRGRTAAMAEVYVDPPLLDAFGLNGGLGDSKMCPTCAKPPSHTESSQFLTTAMSSLWRGIQSGCVCAHSQAFGEDLPEQPARTADRARR